MAGTDEIPNDLILLPSNDEIRAESGSSQFAPGWTSRPFHPKIKGHKVMKNHFI